MNDVILTGEDLKTVCDAISRSSFLRILNIKIKEQYAGNASRIPPRDVHISLICNAVLQSRSIRSLEINAMPHHSPSFTQLIKESTSLERIVLPGFAFLLFSQTLQILIEGINPNSRLSSIFVAPNSMSSNPTYSSNNYAQQCMLFYKNRAKRNVDIKLTFLKGFSGISGRESLLLKLLFKPTFDRNILHIIFDYL